MQLKVPESLSPQVHSGVLLGMVTEVCWQGLLKNDPNWLCIPSIPITCRTLSLLELSSVQFKVAMT